MTDCCCRSRAPPAAWRPRREARRRRPTSAGPAAALRRNRLGHHLAGSDRQAHLVPHRDRLVDAPPAAATCCTLRPLPRNPAAGPGPLPTLHSRLSKPADVARRVAAVGPCPSPGGLPRRPRREARHDGVGRLPSANPVALPEWLQCSPHCCCWFPARCLEVLSRHSSLSPGPTSPVAHTKRLPRTL